MTAEPIQEPITGREELSNLGNPVQALAQFCRAFNGRDLGLMEQNWDNSEEVVMDNPLGGIKRGWREIRTVYERIFDGSARFEVEFYDYTLHVNGDIFYAVGRERGQLKSGLKSLDLSIRTTRIFRMAGSRWRQVHHHGSIENPQLLAEYQQAVR